MIYNFSDNIVSLVVFFFRNYIDTAKVKRFREKSGATAELYETYNKEPAEAFDLYNDRWDFAEHMQFFIPACVRNAHTITMGNATSTSNIQRKRQNADDDDFEDSVRIIPYFMF